MAADALIVDDLEGMLIAGKIPCDAQGFGVPNAASKTFGWVVPLPKVARMWRAGCIIRSDVLNDLAAVLTKDVSCSLMLAPMFAAHLTRTLGALRRVVAADVLACHAMPAPSAELAWFGMIRTAQGFERVDGQAWAVGWPWVKSTADPNEPLKIAQDTDQKIPENCQLAILLQKGRGASPPDPPG